MASKFQPAASEVKQGLSASVRMYRLHELGDCFLLTFRAGPDTSRMLIDCGSFRNSGASKARLKEIVAHIDEECDKKGLNVVVGTHQHNDHLSGFVHCHEEFKAIGVKEVWLSWLDDPKDGLAKGVADSQRRLTKALYAAREGLKSRPIGARGRSAVEVLDDMLGFYGAKGSAPPALPAQGTENLRVLSGKAPEYLRPGRVLDMPGLPPGLVRVYVLGPPRDTDLLYRKNPRTGESYDHALAAAELAATKWLDASACRMGEISSEEQQYPFNGIWKRRKGTGSSELRKLISKYRSPACAWRTIDDDWLEQGESLALFLDSYTNNSSVVLAIELVESGKVLLFAADAQTGNWLSWEKIPWVAPGISLDDLLKRTVLYKVGHHASHNATLVAMLEKMTHPDLVALIPVHKKDPNIAKENGWRMPAPKLLRKLRKKTSNRVLQMDDKPALDCHPGKEPALSSWKNCGIKPRITPLFIELEFAARKEK